MKTNNIVKANPQNRNGAVKRGILFPKNNRISQTRLNDNAPDNIRIYQRHMKTCFHCIVDYPIPNRYKNILR